MTATADSRMSSKICAISSNDKSEYWRDGPVFPSRVRRRWPAIIFAASRTARVPGRITFLIVSIKTIRGISGPGVPAGTKCANMC